MSEQVELLPEVAPRPTSKSIPLDELPKTFANAVPPSRDFVENVKRVGVLEPILVVEKPSGEGYLVAAGKRRLMAARAADLAAIPARVFPHGSISPDVLLLIENEQRRSNPVAELAAIRGLLKAGASERDVYRATGMPVATIKRRLRLAALVTEPIFDGIKSGNVKVSVAEQIVKLPPSARDRLADVLEETGRITAKDVAALKRVRQSQEATTLPGGLFDGSKSELRDRGVVTIERLHADLTAAGASEVVLRTLEEAAAALAAWSAA
jgi:ParB family chromosome partitioning protein